MILKARRGPAPDIRQNCSPFTFRELPDSSAPLTLILAPEGNASQIGFWESTLLTSVARKAVDFAEARSPAGYRFVANFLPASEAKNGGAAGMYVQAGGQLGLYV